ncbi:MAG: hypothetical protein HYU66_26440 [Armatimonadetes bacterium]|nr:hypothetical protein [Armatimonadota bacterium]
MTGEGTGAFSFFNLVTTLPGSLGDPFAVCALALDLQTNVPQIPGHNHAARATCYPRFGYAGATAALVGAPAAQLRDVLKEVVGAAPDLPHSTVGGPFAFDHPDNRGSYVFNFGNLTEQTVDAWIDMCHALGVNEIDFHGGGSFRFGDMLPNPTWYPDGAASMRKVIDRLHAAGILAGLHTYAFFIDKRCPWVTPKPDPRLGKDRILTLAADLPAAATTLTVNESTTGMSATTGFFVHNSNTLQIGDELITYTAVSQAAPFTFSGLTRGALGTQVAAHEAGDEVAHLRECFGLFVPDGDSTLLTDVAAHTANLYNDAGFDMIYLDALDGEGAIAGGDVGWHYGSKFTFELAKRLDRSAIMEMSTFHHHLWYVRARMGAWDHPNRSHKRFIDLHVDGNRGLDAMFLPANLGWWAFKTWSGPTGEPTFPDDIEYLCAKALSTDTGLSIMGITPENRDKVPALPRLAEIVRQWESLRHAGYFDDHVRAALATPGRDYTLERKDAEWQFRRVEYPKHKVECLDDWSSAWTVDNAFAEQPLQLRIEALQGAGAYEAEGNPTLSAFAASEFGAGNAPNGIQGALASSAEQVKAGGASGKLTATNGTAAALGAWCRFERTYDPPLNLSAHPAMGVWVHGDGQGELLNLQLQSPYHLAGGIGDHYITVDFTGWRYFELIEPEGERWAQHRWPYGNAYAIYREAVHAGAVGSLSVYLNELPPGKPVTVYLSPVRGLAPATCVLRNPSISAGGKTLTFPVTLETGQVLEYRGGEAVVYGPEGGELQRVKPTGETPTLTAGANALKVGCEADGAVRPRANVTVISLGEELRGKRPDDQIRWEYLGGRP